jgi:MarR family transcriptional regulator, organic hydroperoxide resistance regulator
MSARSAASSVDLDDLLCFAIHSAGFAFNRIYRRPLQRLGLTYPQYLVMIALWGGEGATVGQLGEQLALETSTLTPLLKRLEAMGLVTRRRSEADERRVMVALTEKGRALRKQAADVTGCIAESAGLPLAKLAKLTRDIRALRANLERAAAKADAA